ncbi:putative Ig domain-containing protein [Tessaracoccus oleiagri]|uniref:Putative Ig domain-containing protein n=1 Tax=Tessaracoccus oleiagri TaxID=686624 RepID=A0A1G9LX08_9ACTN|nr:putative Ig domain-containing protein [Tessaracoccus oleiagri]SDL66498.1 Putative Ig domain-containing protein [Tessaracoccus oleiagri]
MHWIRSLAIGALGAALASTALVAPVSAETPTSPVIEDLGAPITTTRNTQSTAGHWVDGRPVLYMVSSQAEQTLQFSVIDIATGQQLRQIAVDGISQSHNILLGPDGKVYIASWSPTGNLIRYSPGADVVEDLGQPIPGDTVITYLETGEDGLIYGGGYPSGEVFSFDTNTGTFTRMGVAVEGEQYARSMAYVPELDTLFVGTEGSRMHMVAINVATGEKTTIPSPEWATTEARHYHLHYANGLLFSYTSPSLDWHVYDVAAGEWIQNIDRNAQGGMAGPDADGNTYFVQLSKGLTRYDTNTREVSHTGWKQGLTSADGAAGISLIDLKDPAWPGETVVGMDSRGILWKWNPATGQGTKEQAESPAFGVTIRSLSHIDGRIWIGGSSGAVTVDAYDIATGTFANFQGGPTNRVDAWAEVDDKVYFSTYPQGSVYELDPSQPYVWGRNPDDIFGVASQQQERIYALEVVDETSMVAGTIGGRDINTGILVHYDTATDVRTDLGAPIQGLSNASLTHRDKLLVGGTSIEVLGGESPHPGARLFIMDLDTRELVWDGAPIEGARDYVELTMDDEGFLWGLTSQGIVFKFDLETKEVLGQVTVGAAGGIWGMGTLEFGPDGLLYGATALGEVFVADPESLETKKITDGEHAVLDADGRLYFGRDGHLYRATPEENPFPDTTAPVVEPIDLTLVKSGEQVRIQVEATDLRTLTYTAAGLPEGLTIDPDTGLISGAHDWVGTSRVTVTVEDSRGNATEQSFRLVVEGPPARR